MSFDKNTQRMSQNWYLDEAVDRMFKEIFGPTSVVSPIYNKNDSYYNVKGPTSVMDDDGENYSVSIPVPGAQKSDFTVEATDKTLTLTFKPSKSNKYVIPFVKTWTLKDAVFVGTVVTLTDGVLTLLVPKLKAKKPEVVSISIK